MEYTMENKVSNAILEEKIKEAKELLWANEYVIKKMTKSMKEDSDKCETMGYEGDCMGCSCSVCLVQ